MIAQDKFKYQEKTVRAVKNSPYQVYKENKNEDQPNINFSTYDFPFDVRFAGRSSTGKNLDNFNERRRRIAME